MKNLLSCVVEAKTNASLIFTAILTVYSIGDLISPGHGLSGLMILEVLLLALVCGTLQVLVSSGLLWKRLSYGVREILLGAFQMALIVGFGLVCDWFPADRLNGWIDFLVTAMVIYAVITAGFVIRFRVTGRRYTDLLEERQGERKR